MFGSFAFYFFYTIAMQILVRVQTEYSFFKL